jgi:ribosomal protein S18 acetylase RimI-like enzyme
MEIRASSLMLGDVSKDDEKLYHDTRKAERRGVLKIMEIRAARLDEKDLETIVGHRRGMFFDMGHRDEQALDLMSGKFGEWLRRTMEAEEYLAWFAVSEDGAVMGGAGLWLMDWPPHMIGGGRWRGNIVNVYTEREYRRRGIARELMKAAMGWCEKNEVETVVLHASAEGRALYESLGFEGTNEMRLVRRK